MIIKKCLVCQKEFSVFPCHKNAKLCSEKCRIVYMKIANPNWKGGKARVICKNCKKEFTSIRYGENVSKFCSKKCYSKWMVGRRGNKWGGGIKKNWAGYTEIYMPEHPFCNSNNYIKEHRYSAECILGRFLKPSEIIHHIDKDRANNLPENLYLFRNQKTHKRLFHWKIKIWNFELILWKRAIKKSNLI